MSEEFENSNEIEDKAESTEFEETVSIKESWSYHSTHNWAWGASLILVGVLFLLDNFGITSIRTYNWWAIFILAPGMSMLNNAYVLYKKNNGFTRGSSRTGVFGLVLVLVAISFLFGIGFDLLWPVLLISGGIYLLFSKK